MELIKVKTISQAHVAQLICEHYWDGEYSFAGKTILGKLPDGFLLVQDPTRQLHRIAPIAFIEFQLQELGCYKRNADGSKTYCPPPHTELSQKARALYDAIPQVFID